MGAVLAAPAGADPPPHDLLPVPARVEWGEGRWRIGREVALATRGPREARVEAAVARLAQRLARRGSRLRRVASGRAALGLEYESPGLPVQAVGEDESYALGVTPRGARLTAPNPLGILRGIETLLQLARGDGAALHVPAVTIEDRPRFPWRGLLIDSCRHFMPLDVIRRNLDGMAAVKLNVLHWHLTEDQGFRVESRVFPRLHQLGSDGSYYTQEQIREVVAYARERGIRVVPEFDMPGHSTSWLVGHPELGSAPGPYALIRRWGIFDNALDPTREEVYAFLDRFLGEMASLFPDEHVHIGGDEVTPRQWNENPRIQEFLYQRGMRDSHDLQAHFNGRVGAILARLGKRIVGWDEVLHPGLPRDAVIQSWRGARALAEAARQGFGAILSDGYYLDHILPASRHYAVDPLPPGAGLPAEAVRRVLGGEACMWSEYVGAETVDSRIWPRTAAIAERLWSPADVRDADDMYRRLEVQSARLEEHGLTHRSSFEPMLRRILGDGPLEPLARLAEVVEPVTLYRRGALRTYGSDTPLDRLVDAARPESDAARRFRREVAALLRAGPPFASAASAEASLAAWRDNHARLEPLLAARPETADVRSLSRDLSALGALGLEAIAHLREGRVPSAEWGERAERLLDGARAPRAEVELAVTPGVRLLELAARQQASVARDAWPAWVAARGEAARWRGVEP